MEEVFCKETKLGAKKESLIQYQEKAGEVRSLSQGSLKVEKADRGGRSWEMAMWEIHNPMLMALKMRKWGCEPKNMGGL